MDKGSTIPPIIRLQVKRITLRIANTVMTIRISRQDFQWVLLISLFTCTNSKYAEIDSVSEFSCQVLQNVFPRFAERGEGGGYQQQLFSATTFSLFICTKCQKFLARFFTIPRFAERGEGGGYQQPLFHFSHAQIRRNTLERGRY